MTAGRGKHPEFMRRGTLTLRLPNRHAGDIGIELLKRLLNQGQMSADEWLGTGSFEK